MRIATLSLLLLFPFSLLAQDPAATIPFLGAELFGADRSHSRVAFTIGFLGMSEVGGTFKSWNASILYDDEKPERSSVTVVIDAESIDTGFEGRDKDLAGPTFFDAKTHPQIVFQSNRIERKSGETYLVSGNLTMKGVTKPISFPMTRTVKRTPDAGWGNIRIGGAGRVVVKRSDFGVTGNEFWGKMLSDEVTIDISLLGNRPNYDRWTFNSREKPSIGEVLQTASVAEARKLWQEKPAEYNFAADQIGIAANRLLQKGKVREAIEILQFGLEVHPDQWAFHARLGESWARLGDRKKAAEAYQKVLTINPNGPEALEMSRRVR